jgi:hypothetical protein
MELGATLAMKKIPFAFTSLGGNCFIDQARNALIQKAMDTSKYYATDIFFLDDDVGFPAKAAIDLLERPEDIVCGVYPKKADTELYPVSLLVDDDGKFIESDDGVLKLADMICGGFLRIKRHVLEKMSEGAETYPYLNEDGSVVTVTEIFESGRRNGLYFGEDTLFAYKAQKAGFDIWCKPDITFTHRGSKAWRGNVAEFLKGKST